MAARSLVLALWLAVCTVCAACAACASRAAADRPAAAAHAARAIQHVILVTVDGLLPESYLDPDAHGLQVPTLRRMASEGAKSAGMLSVFPSVTYPAHTSIATGVDPGAHGIVTNLAFDPLERNHGGWRWYAEDIRVPTLWDAAAGAGLTTALISWPVTVGARARLLVPELWRAGTPDDVKLVRALSTPGLLETVATRFPSFREGFTPPDVADAASTDVAVHILETERPGLVLLHVWQVDDAQHRHGPWSPEARKAVENADEQIGRLVVAAQRAGIWERTVLIVASDHGFARVRKVLRPGVLLARAGLLATDKDGKLTSWRAAAAVAGGLAYVYLADPADQAAQGSVRSLFEPLAGKPDTGIGRLYDKAEIARRGGDPTAFLALGAAEGYSFASGLTGEPVEPAVTSADHGYDPEEPAMRASLLIYGPAVVPGPIEQARLTDIAPTVAGLLGLQLPTASGRPLPVRLR